MSRERNWMQSIRDNDRFHSDLMPGVPIVEICDQTRVLIENHNGIIGYRSDEIRIKVRFGCICICGEALKLTRMSKCKLVVTGKINAVQLKGRGQL